MKDELGSLSQIGFASRMPKKPRFSLRAFAIAMTVICIWLGWRYTLKRVGLRELCQEMVQVSLKEEHLNEAIDGGDLANSYMQELFSTNRPFVVDFIKADGTMKSGGKVDDLEKNLLKRFSASSNDEYFERTGTTYKYYEPVRAEKECVACHPGSAPGKLMAVISIQPGTRANRGQSLIEQMVGFGRRSTSGSGKADYPGFGRRSTSGSGKRSTRRRRLHPASSR